MLNEDLVLEKLKAGDIEAFEVLYKKHYAEQVRLCYKYVHDVEVARDLVQDVFLKLWQKRADITIRESVGAYLYASTKNHSINYLKKVIAQDLPENHAIDFSLMQSFEDAEKEIQKSRLIKLAIDQLPGKCRIIFNMSFINGLTYNEIAEELGLSSKTVKAQKAIGLKKMAEYLKIHRDDLLIMLLLFFFSK